MPPADSQLAFVDESFHESHAGGFYVLAAAVFKPAVYERARKAMRDILAKRNTSKLHLNEMDAQQRRNAVKTVSGIDGLYVVTVGTPVPRKRQDRARAKCLHRLALELHSYGITHLLVESRTRQLDRRDVDTVIGARYQLPMGADLRVDHQVGSKEPLFWAADIVAGAVRAHREGVASYLTYLEDCVYVIAVATECGHA